MTAKPYINSIAPAVKSATSGTGLFASVMIAQAVNEGGSGKSLLAAKYNNHFGIKASGGWTGQTVKIDSNEVRNGVPKKEPAIFRVYDSLESGFADRVKFLQENPRYKKGGVFSATTPEAQAQALQASGYATDPRYASKLIAIIAEYNLKQYDTPGSAEAEKKKPTLKPGFQISNNIILIVIIATVALIIFFALQEIK